MATGSSGLPGRCEAMRSVPPCLMPPAAGVVSGATVVSGLGAAVVSAPPAAVVSGVAALSSPQAAMTAPMNAVLRPTTLPRTRKPRRESDPLA